MTKLTLSLIMLIMQYQGRDGKYYIIQKVSVIVSAFLSFFVTGLLTVLIKLPKDFNWFFFFCFWLSTFIAHYVWFLKKKKTNLILHFKDYKKYLYGFLLFILISIFIWKL